MILYRKSICCDLYQTFDETGTLLNQWLHEWQTDYSTIDSETCEEEDADLAELPSTLELTPQLAESGTGERDKLRTYNISVGILVRQLFDANGKLLGQLLKGYYDEVGFSVPYGSVENWNGWKMKATDIERDEDLPFPHIPLPFPYVLHTKFVRPKRLSKEEKFLVKVFL